MAYHYVPITVNGSAKILQVPFGSGCSVESGGQPAGSVILDAMPATPDGNEVLEVDCGTIGETEAVYVTAPPINNTNPLPTDGTAWTAGNPNDTDDQGKAVTYSDPNILIDQKTN